MNAASYSLTWDPTVLQCLEFADNNSLPSQQDFGDLAPDNTVGTATIGQIAFAVSNPEACATKDGVMRLLLSPSYRQDPAT